MFSFIKGTLESKRQNSLIIESNGIGYNVNTSFFTIGAAGDVGTNIKLFTYLYVREDILSLYGFLTQDELNIFELLISISGIGPKAAISIMSTLSPSKFGLAVITDNFNELSKAQGIGLKTAKRIVLELKDKIKNELLVEESNNCLITTEFCKDEQKIKEAVSALMVLGYSYNEANKAVSSICSNDIHIEDMIKKALKELSK